MSFIGSIFSAVTSVGSFLFGHASSVVSNIAGSIGPILSDVANIASNVTTTIKNALGTAFNAITGITGNILNGIGGFVKSTSSFIEAFVKPISTFVGEIGDFVKRINTNFVEPIRQAVLTTYSEYKLFTEALQGDLHQGILGLLAIPGQLADALTSVDAQFQRATVALGYVQKQIVDQSLVPGIKASVGDPIAEFSKAYLAQTNFDYSKLAELQHVQLTEPLSKDQLKKWYFDILAINDKSTGVFNIGWTILSQALSVLPIFEALHAPQMETIRQEAALDLPTRTLDASEIVRALYRGIIPFAQAQEEAGRQGISPDRLRVLMENAAWLPGGRELADMQFRGAITAEEAAKTAAQIGYTGESWNALLEAALAPPDARQAIVAYQRRAAGDAGLLPASLTSPTPQNVVDAARAASMRQDRAEAEWLAHWEIPGIEWWITAFFRELVTAQEVYQAAEARGIPQELVPKLIPASERVIELWMIPDMLAKGVLTPEQAAKYLHYVGLSADSAQIIQTYAEAKSKGPKAASLAKFAEVSISQAKDMYDVGIIDELTYTQILEAHGFTTEVAALAVDLAKQDKLIKSRKLQAEEIVAEFKVGSINKQQGIQKLYALGYTTPEVDIYAEKMRLTASAKQKLPTEAQLNDMLRYGILDPTQWEQAMAAIGYNTYWIPYLFALEVILHGNPPDTGTVGLPSVAVG